MMTAGRDFRISAPTAQSNATCQTPPLFIDIGPDAVCPGLDVGVGFVVVLQSLCSAFVERILYRIADELRALSRRNALRELTPQIRRPFDGPGDVANRR